MTLNEDQKDRIRAAIYTRSVTPPSLSLKEQETLADLSAAIVDGSWTLWYDFQTVQGLRDFPANEPYRGDLQALLDIIGNPEVKPPPIVVSPDPEGYHPPADEPYEPADIAELRQEVASLKAMVAAVTQGALVGVVPVNGVNSDIGFQFNTGTVTHRLYGNPEDYGLRLWFNYREPYVNGSSSSIPTLPQMALFMEQDGAISFIYGKPQTSPAGPYDKLDGKALLFRGGGWGDTGQRDKNVSIYTGQVGRGLQLGVCRTNPNYPDRFDLQIDPNSDNPISITVGGQLRRVVVDESGFLRVE